jgi:hypothetical protein
LGSQWTKLSKKKQKSKKRDKISQLDPFRREQGLRVPFFLEGMELFYGLHIWGEK